MGCTCLSCVGEDGWRAEIERWAARQRGENPPAPPPPKPRRQVIPLPVRDDEWFSRRHWLMEKAYAALEEYAVEGPVTQHFVEKAIHHRAVDVRAALARLVEEGYVERRRGTFGAYLFTPVRPFGVREDVAG